MWGRAEVAWITLSAWRVRLAARYAWNSTRSECVPEAIPADWTFFVAHSLRLAEKSGMVREEYNQPGVRWLRRATLSALRHGLSERERVELAVLAMRRGDPGSIRRTAQCVASQLARRSEGQLRAGRPTDGGVPARRGGGRKNHGSRVRRLCGGALREAIEQEDVLARVERDHFAQFPERAGFPDYLMPVEAGDGALTHAS